MRTPAGPTSRVQPPDVPAAIRVNHPTAPLPLHDPLLKAFLSFDPFPDSDPAILINSTAHPMNTPKTDTSGPEDPELAADAIIDDLNTEDVLPPDESDVIPDTEEPEDSDPTREESWSGLGADLGHRASKPPLEDEFAATQDLVNAGVEEADDELRELEDEDEEDRR